MDNNNKKNKNLAKDIGILIAFLGPILFIIIGAMIWLSDGFDGTAMEKIYPAIFFGFIAGIASLLSFGLIFRNTRIVAIIVAIIVFIATFITCFFDLRSEMFGILAIVVGLTMLTILITWIAGGFKKK